MPFVRLHVFIDGQVQGVFFRANTQEQARAKCVTGWVRNLPDGRVEAVFEGDKRVVDGMLAWCRHGPPGAQVTNVEAVWEEYRGEFRDFRIRY